MDGHDHPSRFTRREVIQLLGGAAGLGLVTGCRGDQGASSGNPTTPSYAR